MPDIDTVWQRIESHTGETFHQKLGGAFKYEVTNGQVRPDRTNQQIPRSHFEKALAGVPLQGPGRINDLRGPSYIYAILMDPRIRQDEW
jgi:hypothetical protein